MRHLIAIIFVAYSAMASQELPTQVTDCSHILDPKEDILGFADLYPNLRESYPLLTKIVTGAVRQRMKKAGEEWSQLETIMSSCSKSACSISLGTSKFEFRGTAQIVGEEVDNKTMEIAVQYFAAAHRADESGKKKIIKLRKTAEGPNFQFLYLMGTIFSAAHSVLDRHPEVKTIRIKAGNVVNETLAESLRDMGFRADESKRQSEDRMDRVVKFIFKGVAPGFVYLLTWKGRFHFFNPANVIVKSLSVAGFIALEYRPFKSTPFRPNNWTLEIPAR